jgi:predicted nucleic acid-binding protein
LIVVDASVAVRWIPEEEGAELSSTILGRGDLSAPDLLVVEVASALRRKLELGQLTSDQVSEGFRLIFGRVRHYPPSTELMNRSIELSIALSHSIYDCVYVAQAEAIKGQLVTNDHDLANRIRRAGLGSLVVDLPLQ